jgi:hypothetical protein
MISNAIIDLAKEVHRAVILPQSVKKPPQDSFRHWGGSGPLLVFSVKPAKVLAFAKGTFGQTRRRF